MITESSRARLAPGVMLRQDRARGQWTLLGPERVLVLDEQALEVVRACVEAGGTVGDGVDRLAEAFDAPRGEIAGDVIEMLDDMRERGWIVV